VLWVDRNRILFFTFLTSVKNMSFEEQPVVVLACYSEEEWQRLKLVADDIESLDATYEEWRSNLQKLIEHLKLNEQPYIKHFVTVDELQAWCREQRRLNDRAARAAYVAMKGRQESR